VNWFTGLIVYVLVWWVALFAVLPLWVAPADPSDPGHAAGAPKQPRLGRKAVVTSLVAAVIWLAIFALLRSPWLSFHGS
jgi:predicted secreted protein